MRTTTAIVDSLLEIVRQAVREVLRDELSACPPIQPRLLDAKQAGHYISRPETMVRKLARERKIRVSSSDSRLLFDRRDLDSFIEREKEAGHAA